MVDKWVAHYAVHGSSRFNTTAQDFIICLMCNGATPYLSSLATGDEMEGNFHGIYVGTKFHSCDDLTENLI